MTELIRIETREGIETVSARELHQKLEVGRDFSSWVKDRIERYGFIEGADYLSEVFPNSGEKGGRPSIQYHLSLDMAKELAMVENSEQGRNIRRYFIEVEKLSKMGGYHPTPMVTEADKTAWALKLAVDVLKPNEIGRLIMTKKALELVNAPTGFLPDYSKESPKGLSQSATSLLKEHGLTTSARAFNVLAKEHGLLEVMERASSKGTKEFWHLTDAGLAFGENAMSPHNPRETQPLWFTATFGEVLKKVGLNELPH